MNSVALLAAAATALAGCGNYSTEDLRFFAALPRRADLHLKVPVEGAPPPGALVGRALVTPACPVLPGEATIWKEGKTTSDKLNAGVDWVVGLIDVVRKYPPTEREDDWRRWGPFDDEKHPRRELRIDITRSYPAELAGLPRYAYAFEARVKGSGLFIPLIAGEFDGDSSSDGKGWVELRFDNFRVLQMADGTTPDGTMRIDYDRVGDPRFTDLSLETNGFGVVQFDYGYAGYADGSGAFDYAFRTLDGDRLEARTSYDTAGAGRLRVQFTAAAGGTGSFDQCWNAAGCLVYVDDVFNFTQSCGSAPCLVGTTADCATVPAPPF